MASTLSKVLQASSEANPGLTGIHLLADPLEAFAARVQLVDTAQQTLDVQYYIWAGDTTGRLLLQALCRAADRGVQVRLLLDDLGCLGSDPLFSAIDMYPGIEVRLFNPLLSRRWKLTGYITDFSRIHRRMHNKSLTVDKEITIVGGRNIGDAYFSSGEEDSFLDLDALAVGAVAKEIARDFDRYWCSAATYPAADFLPALTQNEQQQILTDLSQHRQSTEAARYEAAARRSRLIDTLVDQNPGLQWVAVTMVSDDPAKALGKPRRETLISQQLVAALGRPRHRVTLVSPYFIPMASGLRLLRDLGQEGIDVCVLTNSMAVNDMLAAHAGYAKYRKALLHAGVTLYEMRAFQSPSPDHRQGESDRGRKHKPRGRRKLFRLRRSIGNGRGAKGVHKSAILGTGGASLHAKTFAVDSEKLFIGSFNFDPRSTRLNTELGFVIESPPLAAALETFFDDKVAQISYQVSLSPGGRLQWREDQGTSVVYHRHEPHTSWPSRLLVRFFTWLPIESFL